MAETIASACGVLNNVGVVTVGAGPRIRPSWLIRSARAANAIVDVTSKATPRFHSLQNPFFVNLVHSMLRRSSPYFAAAFAPVAVAGWTVSIAADGTSFMLDASAPRLRLSASHRHCVGPPQLFTEVKPNLPLEIGHVLFTDVVGYSKLLIVEVLRRRIYCRM